MNLIKSSGLALAVLAVIAMIGSPALANEQQLREEMRMLKQRLADLEERLEASEQRSQAGGSGGGSMVSNLVNGITISGVVEVEASSTDNAAGDFLGEDGSDINLATVELGIDAQITDWVDAHLLLKHEGDDDLNVFVDEGIITISNPDETPFFLAVGRMYVPFGSFETNMVTDPLTLDIGETRDTALQVGYEGDGFYASAFLYNGDIQDNAENTIEQYGASAGIAMESDDLSYDLGLGYISNISDSAGITDFLGGAGTIITSYVDGFNAHGLVTTGPFTLVGEYMAATDSFAAADMAFNGVGAEPTAWHLELGYGFAMGGNDATFAVTYNGTDEALALGLPEQRYGAALSVGIYENTTWSLEWLHDEDYDVADGGTGNSADTITTQLAVEF